MTRKFTILLLGLTLTTALCGCSSSTTDYVEDQNNTAVSTQQTSTASSGEEQSSSTEQISTQNEVSLSDNSEGSAPEASSGSSAVQEESDKTSAPENSVTESRSDGEGSEDEPIIYIEPEDQSSVDPEEASKYAAREYLNNGQIPIDVADKNINTAAVKDLNKPLYIDSYQEFTKFYSDNKNSWSLDEVENGETFSSAATEFDETFFENQCVIITLQQYEKGTDIEVGDVYRDSKGSMITICKESAKSQASGAYMLFLITVQKADLNNTKPEIEIVSAENYIEND